VANHFWIPLQSCKSCGAGFYSNSLTGSLSCTACPGGSDSASPGGFVSSCTLCASGFFNPTPGQSCLSCGASFYSNSLTGSLSCTACPAGSDSLAPGGLVSSCTSCASRFFNPTPGQLCQSCVVNFYSNSITGSTACTPCPGGSYSSTPGSLVSSCTPCALGKASSIVGVTSSTTCQDCGPGLFADVPSLSSCKACPPGTVTTNLGSIACAGNATLFGGLPLGGVIGISIGAVIIAAIVAIVGGMFLYKRFTARHDDYSELTKDKGDGVFYKM
jgi:hypothetical protein